MDKYKQKILWVDDTYEMMPHFFNVLNENYNLLISDNLNEAVEIIKNHSADLKGVIIDSFIPGDSDLIQADNRSNRSLNEGHYLVKYLNQSYPKIKKFYLTNYRNKVRDSENDIEIINKSISSKELIDICERIFFGSN